MGWWVRWMMWMGGWVRGMMREPGNGLLGRSLPVVSAAQWSHHRHCYQFSCFLSYFVVVELLLWRLIWIERLYSDSKLSESCQNLTVEKPQFAKRTNVVLWRGPKVAGSHQPTWYRKRILFVRYSLHSMWLID